MPETPDLTAKMDSLDRRLAEERLKNINPDDAKYATATDAVRPYLSADAEWRAFAFVQQVLIETRCEFGQAERRHVEEVERALSLINPLNMALLEEQITKHDQLAVIEEIGRFVSPETKALLHPGTTSYDIVDTARAYLFQGCWRQVLRPKIVQVIEKLSTQALQHMDLLQVGRTHLQDTSPITFGSMLAGYSRRLAECVETSGAAFGKLRGKISGIVGTGASIEVVIGRGRTCEFEKTALEKLGLEADPASTQVVHKENLFGVANSVVSLSALAANFANRMRLLYSSSIGEVTSRDGAQRLGGSSADAGKNNPINWENIAGKAAVIESAMRIIYAQAETDCERDLRNSVQARYEPQLMMTRLYETLSRWSKAMDTLSVNEGVMRDNLLPVRKRPTEAMTAVTRAHCYIHPVHGIGHDAVKHFAREAQKSGKKLIDIALADEHFNAAHSTWPEWHQKILQGDLEEYLGFAKERALENIAYASRICGC